jgi:hypothetical protein
VIISLSSTVFAADEKFHNSGHVNWHNCIIWGSEPPREHSEHEWDSPKVNVWCVLQHERVTGLFFFDEDIITSNSFLDMLENYALLQFKNNNNNLILHLDSAPVHFAHTVCCLNVNSPG